MFFYNSTAYDVGDCDLDEANGRIILAVFRCLAISRCIMLTTLLKTIHLRLQQSMESTGEDLSEVAFGGGVDCPPCKEVCPFVVRATQAPHVLTHRAPQTLRSETKIYMRRRTKTGRGDAAVRSSERHLRASRVCGGSRLLLQSRRTITIQRHDCRRADAYRPAGPGRRSPCIHNLHRLKF